MSRPSGLFRGWNGVVTIGWLELAPVRAKLSGGGEPPVCAVNEEPRITVITTVIGPVPGPG